MRRLTDVGILAVGAAYCVCLGAAAVADAPQRWVPSTAYCVPKETATEGDSSERRAL